jgi:hypothetical protein
MGPIRHKALRALNKELHAPLFLPMKVICSI